MNYVNLYTQTEYSILSSNIAMGSIAKKAKEKNYTALGIADNDNMHGAIKFYSECRKEGIKPIIGVRLSLNSKYGYKNAVLLYAKNNDGYKNLFKIVSLKCTTKKDMYLEDIKDYLSDLVVIIPSDENELVYSYLMSDFENMQKILKEYLALKDIPNLSLYLGLDLQTRDSKYKLGDLIYFGNQYKITPVAIRKTNYYEDEDYEVYTILRSVAKGGTLYKGTEKEENSSLINAVFMSDMYRKYPELVAETETIANMCNVEIDFGTYHMPKYILDKENTNTDEYLKTLAFAGLKKRLAMEKVEKKDCQVYIDRLNYELSVIQKMGFSDYFLIVYDFIRFAKKEGILVGPGRGSAVGSLVAYSTGITEINPIKYNLLFERFLNPNRSSMPDIDTDFPDDRIGEVRKYVCDHYGANRVCHICTFGRYGAISSIKAIARVIDLKKIYLDSIERVIKEDDKDKSLKDIIQSNPELAQMAESNEIIKKVLHLALRMEKLPYSVSIHAAGIIIADKDLNEYMPYSENSDGICVSHFNDDDLEKIGLLKIDFLTLQNLTMIVKVLDMIGVKGKDALKIYNIPLNVKEVYRMLANGYTSGLFQINTKGMTQTIVGLKANSFNDIISTIALYRRGPMDMIPDFTNRKLGKEKITYPHPSLEPILKETYGVIVYQEQILEIAKTFAGFTLGEADVLRSAVSKKKEDLLVSQREKFIKGAIANGHSEKDATFVFERILKFAQYGFNKSHAVVYSLIAYQMAYLKARHFKEFMSVILSYPNDKNEMRRCLRELNVFGATLNVPDVNKSGIDFVVEDNKIYYSLIGVSEIGTSGAKSIIKEREDNGLFKSYDDFIVRTKGFLTRKMVESLIYAGALDSFGVTRKSMILEYDMSRNLADYGDLFKEEIQTREYDSEEFNFVDISNYEKKALGFNIKYDLFAQYGYLRRKYGCTKLCDLHPEKYYNIFFVLDSVREIKTKDGKNMAFARGNDETGDIELTIFPKTYSEYGKYLVSGKIMVAKGKCELNKGKLQFVLDKVFIDNKE